MIDMIPPKAGRLISSGITALILAMSRTVAFAEAAPANSNAAAAAEMATPLTPADKKFIKEASESLYLEMAIVDIALRRNRPVGATSDAAKNLGDKLQPELKKTWEELSTFAQSKKEKLRDELTGVDKREVEQLRSLDIDKFNKQVVALLGKETKKLAQIFESKSMQHPVLKKFAEEHLPAFKSHLNDVAPAGK
jgi:predicted outer membrane protein